MGKHRSRSRSRSRSNKKNRQHRDRSRDRSGRDRPRERSRERDRDFARQSRSPDRRERRSKFDVDAGGQRVQRKSKWSDQAPDPSISVYDPNAAKLAAQNLISAITINPEAQNAQNELLNKQAELFGNLLSKARFEGAGADTHIETIRPNAQNANPLTKVLGGSKGFDDFELGQGITDSHKIKRKIYIPKNTNFNYTGLIIGPKGANQKRLEEETGCKILVRGKGSQKEGQPPQPDDNEDLHVLIVGDNEMSLASATAQIERILFADEETRVKIKQEQLKLVAQLKNDPNALQSKGLTTAEGDSDLSMTTPYGPPSVDAYVIQVPNDCVGLVIGKGGETIRQLQMQSGAKKVQVATDSQKGAKTRNIFVEGDRDAYETVRNMIQEIVDQQQKLRQAMTGVLPDNSQGVRAEIPVPDNLVGLVIGRGGETIRSINQRTGAAVFIPKECDPGKNERVLIISGTPDQVEQARVEVQAKVDEGVRNLQFKALQAQGIPVQLMATMGYGDPNFFQQYLSSFDPAYAAMYQQMYAQQPVVTTVTDSSTLPGAQSGYQQQMPTYQQQPSEYMPNYQYQMGAGGQQAPGANGGVDPNMQYQNYAQQNPGSYQGYQYQPGQNNNNS